MPVYSNPEVEALRLQFARFFPQLKDTSTGRMPISNGLTTAKPSALPDGSDRLNLQTSKWHAYQTASPRTAHASRTPTEADSDTDKQQSKRLRQLQTEYKTRIPKQDVARDPVLVRVQQLRDDPAEAIAVLKQALDRDRDRDRDEGAQTTPSSMYAQQLVQWRRLHQEKRQQALQAALHGGDAAEETAAPCEEAAQTVCFPLLPPPLAPCLQCVEARTCCSLTTTPWARAWCDDRTATPAPRRSMRDAYAELVVAEYPDGRAPATVTAALARKKHLVDRALLLAAVRGGDCDSPFLLPPPTQCTRCARRGTRGCLQQSADVTGTTDVVPLDRHGRHVARWFASSGPPPRSLLPQHSQPLLAQMRGPAFYDAAVARSRQQLPLLEAVFCRDRTALSAVAVAREAAVLLGRIFRQRQAAEHSEPHQRPQVRGLLPDEALAGRAQLRAPTGTRPMPAAPADAVARRLPRWSRLDVATGEGVATAALSYGEEGRDGAEDEEVQDYAAAPLALPGWAPTSSMRRAARLREDYFLNVGEDRAAADYQRGERRGGKKEEEEEEETLEEEGPEEEPRKDADDCDDDVVSRPASSSTAAEDRRAQSPLEMEMLRRRLAACRAQLWSVRGWPPATSMDKRPVPAVSPAALARFRRRRHDPAVAMACVRVAEWLRR